MDIKMKFVKILLLLVFAVTVAFADGTFIEGTFSGDTTNTTRKKTDLYIGISSTRATSNDKTIRGDNKPMKEILGGGGFYNELQIGIYSMATNDGAGMKLYGSIYQNSEKNREIGAGFGIEVEKRLIDDIPLNLLMGFARVYGWQTAFDRDTPEGRIEFGIDNKVKHYLFHLGLSCDVAKHLALDLTYTLRLSDYKYSYKYVDTHRKVSQTTGAANSGVRFGLGFRF
jgi:opacity protein-like surface antigen